LHRWMSVPASRVIDDSPVAGTPIVDVGSARRTGTCDDERHERRGGHA
jgi:hypothetical protein